VTEPRSLFPPRPSLPLGPRAQMAFTHPLSCPSCELARSFAAGFVYTAVLLVLVLLCAALRVRAADVTALVDAVGARTDGLLTRMRGGRRVSLPSAVKPRKPVPESRMTQWRRAQARRFLSRGHPHYWDASE
jgi:hypothetical protein